MRTKKNITTEEAPQQEELTGCRACAHFGEQKKQMYCSKLRTHCEKNDDPDLGTNLRRCEFIRREVKE